MKQPLAVTVIAWLFIAVACASVVHGVHHYRHDGHVRDFSYVIASALVAAAGGVLVLRGVKWGRWLLVAWMVFHVFLTAAHDFHSMVAHTAIFAVATWLLFRSRRPSA